MHQSSMRAMRGFISEFLDSQRGTTLDILDVGSMDVNGSYRSLLDDPLWRVTGLDAESGPGVDVVLPEPYDWSALDTRSFDVVVSGQAFEHIEFPWVTILEVARVLRPGGLLCLIAPAAGYEHRYPVDCWRYYPDGVRALAAWADLEVLSAVTSWEPVQAYDDDSADWKDTVLVARKPQAALGGPLGKAKQESLRRLTSFQAARRHTMGTPPG